MNRFRICLFVAMIVLLNLPSVTQAYYQIAPNPNYDTIFISTSDAINNQFFLNYGTLSNSGMLSNYGDLNNTYNYSGNSGTLNNNAGALLINYNSLDNFHLMNNSGKLINYGSLTNSPGNLTNYGLLINYGSLNNHSFSGTLYNYNTLENYGVLTNGGNLLNYSTLNNYNGSSLNNSRELQNYGTLNSYGTLSNSGRVINAGILNVDGNYTQTAGRTVITGNMIATSLMINGGKLDGTGNINGSVTIGNGASINPGVDGPPVGMLTINGSLVSSGALFFDIRFDTLGLGNGGFDVLDINGDVTFTGGTINIDFLDGGSCTQIGSKGSNWTFYYDLLKANSISGWETLDFTINGLPAGVLDWNFNDIDGGKQLVITGYTAVPLPGTIWLFTPMLVVIGVIRRKKTQGLAKDQ